MTQLGLGPSASLNQSGTITEPSALTQNIPSGIIPRTEGRDSRKSSVPSQGRHDQVAVLKANLRCEVMGQRWTGGER